MEYKEVGKGLSKSDSLWRYFDFQKFLSLVIDKSIFFNRMDKMEDKNEGISINQLYFKYGTSIEQAKAIVSKYKSNRKELPLEKRQQKYFLSCWLVHHRESVAMWNSYSNDDGIAIKINAQKLISNIINHSSITDHSEKLKTLYYGKIEYKDFFNKAHRENFKEVINVLGFHKDVSFMHEQEYRFLIKQDLHNYPKDEIQFIKLNLNNFGKIPFTLVFHPKMQTWKKENIKQVLKALKIKNVTCQDSELQLKNWN